MAYAKNIFYSKVFTEFQFNKKKASYLIKFY
jgi:hypothetical protein